jgi:hypothetical protein
MGEMRVWNEETRGGSLRELQRRTQQNMQLLWRRQGVPPPPAKCTSDPNGQIACNLCGQTKTVNTRCCEEALTTKCEECKAKVDRCQCKTSPLTKSSCCDTFQLNNTPRRKIVDFVSFRGLHLVSWTSVRFVDFGSFRGLRFVSWTSFRLVDSVSSRGLRFVSWTSVSLRGLRFVWRTSLHLVSYRLVSFHLASFHFASFRPFSSRLVSFRLASFCLVSLRFVSSRFVSFRFVPLAAGISKTTTGRTTRTS